MLVLYQPLRLTMFLRSTNVRPFFREKSLDWFIIYGANNPKHENRGERHAMADRRIYVSWLLAALLLIQFNCAGKRGTLTLSTSELADKIKGAWAGQMIGVAFGAPTEFRYKGRINESELAWTPDMIKNTLVQDDLYVEMTFCRVIDDQGIDAPLAAFGRAFAGSKYRLWHANLIGRRNIRHGIEPPLSGDPRYNLHCNCIDWQIESDFVGIMSPGMPNTARDISFRLGHLMNYGDGVYGGVFVSACYAAAYHETDPVKVVEAALACLPRESRYARAIGDLLAWYRESPDDWRLVWHKLEKKYNSGRDEICPGFLDNPGNIDAYLNGAYVAMGLLYGGGDLGKTMEIATRCGQDSDCNPSSAAGILGAMLGYNKLDKRYTSSLAAIENDKFSYTDYSFNDICRHSLKWALELVKRGGGRVEGDKVIIKLQSPSPAPLEQFVDFGEPVEVIGAGNGKWRCTGSWHDLDGGDTHSLCWTVEAGAMASTTFRGTGFQLLGGLNRDGGLYEVYVDGEKVGAGDCYFLGGAGREYLRRNEGLYWNFDLEPGLHRVKLKALGTPYRDSEGRRVYLKSLVVFRK